MQDAGFVQYWYRRDYLSAGGLVRQGRSCARGAVGGSSRWRRRPWCRRRSPVVPLDVGSDPRVGGQRLLRTDAERRLLQLRALDEIDALQMGLDQRVGKNGAPAGDWATLIRIGVLRGVPRDPRGTPYELTSNGRVQLSPASPLFPLPEEPPAATRPAS